jgi:hypothetical protein
MKRFSRIVAALMAGIALTILIVLVVARSPRSVSPVLRPATVAATNGLSNLPPSTAQRPDAAMEPGLPYFSSTVTLARERIHMTDHEATVLDRSYRALVADREEVERQLAHRDFVSETAVLITIPQYLETGLELYSDFRNRIASEFGAQRGAEILRKLDAMIRAENKDFGSAEQQLLVENKGTFIEVIHGSGMLIKSPQGLSLAKVNATSQLLPRKLMRYGHLGHLFPDAGLRE